MNQDTANKIMSVCFTKFHDGNGVEYWKHNDYSVVAVLKPEARQIKFCRCESKHLKNALEYAVKFEFTVDVQLEDLIQMILN